jgi:hypothetical protein
MQSTVLKVVSTNPGIIPFRGYITLIALLFTSVPAGESLITAVGPPFNVMSVVVIVISFVNTFKLIWSAVILNSD